MRLVRSGRDFAEVELTRRNLLALLAKLDGHPPHSTCTLHKRGDDGRFVMVRAVEDNAHYGPGTPPGEMDPATEAQL